MRLLLTDDHCRQLIDLAVAGRPNEVCGLLAGQLRPALGVVTAVIPLPNVAQTPRIRYQVDPKAFVEAYRAIERQGDDLIGIYHSHPFGAAIPSATDLAEATWPDTLYVIIGFPDRFPSDIRAWTLRRDAATAVNVVRVDDAPG